MTPQSGWVLLSNLVSNQEQQQQQPVLFWKPLGHTRLITHRKTSYVYHKRFIKQPMSLEESIVLYAGYLVKFYFIFFFNS